MLCTREYQTSIRDSSHKILKDTISRLGLDAWFHVTQDAIRSKTGSEFLFKGLHGNEQSIKSTEGVDICWLEEAQSTSASSWVTLPATIRKPGSEIWCTYNLLDERDPTHSRFYREDGSLKRKDAIVHKINYDSNPYFWSSELVGEMEADKEADYHLYEHVWLGMPLKVSNAIILSGKYTVMEFPDFFEKQADRIHFGADFGFAQDPSTLIRFFPLDNDGKRKLFITHEAYGVGVELDDMPTFYDTVPGSRDWPIKADCARPETISHLSRKGFNISGAEKWEGSVKDGITHLRGFDEIIIHPRCTNTAREARLYKYKTDSKAVDDRGQPLVLPVVIDKNNHCWDAVRYGLDGYIQRSGGLGVWGKLAGN